MTERENNTRDSATRLRMYQKVMTERENNTRDSATRLRMYQKVMTERDKNCTCHRHIRLGIDDVNQLEIKASNR